MRTDRGRQDVCNAQRSLAYPAPQQKELAAVRSQAAVMFKYRLTCIQCRVVAVLRHNASSTEGMYGFTVLAPFQSPAPSHSGYRAGPGNQGHGVSYPSRCTDRSNQLHQRIGHDERASGSRYHSLVPPLHSFSPRRNHRTQAAPQGHQSQGSHPKQHLGPSLHCLLHLLASSRKPPSVQPTCPMPTSPIHTCLHPLNPCDTAAAACQPPPAHSGQQRRSPAASPPPAATCRFVPQ